MEKSIPQYAPFEPLYEALASFEQKLSFHEIIDLKAKHVLINQSYKLIHCLNAQPLPFHIKEIWKNFICERFLRVTWKDYLKKPLKEKIDQTFDHYVKVYQDFIARPYEISNPFEDFKKRYFRLKILYKELCLLNDFQSLPFNYAITLSACNYSEFNKEYGVRLGSFVLKEHKKPIKFKLIGKMDANDNIKVVIRNNYQKVAELIFIKFLVSHKGTVNLIGEVFLNKVDRLEVITKLQRKVLQVALEVFLREPESISNILLLCSSRLIKKLGGWGLQEIGEQEDAHSSFHFKLQETLSSDEIELYQKQQLIWAKVIHFNPILKVNGNLVLDNKNLSKVIVTENFSLEDLKKMHSSN